MGSYVLIGDGIRPEIRASKAPKVRSSGKLPAGTTFLIGEPINVVKPLENGHYTDCKPLYHGGFCDC